MEVVRGLRHFIVEEIRTARRFLRKAGVAGNLGELDFLVFNEHSDNTDLSPYLEPALQGHDTGIISEAGVPCVADPGSAIVRLAHEKGITVVPLTGPASLLLALMASGFNGQNFLFHGYLPIEQQSRARRIREIEGAAYSKDQTQVFIEVPYRNVQLFQALLGNCREGTLICVATDLTAPAEMIRVKTVKDWKGKVPDINKRPTVFLLYK
jgi:16S rRNA (cytidine1402-2'-O)-methyltransferase